MFLASCKFSELASTPDMVSGHQKGSSAPFTLGNHSHQHKNREEEVWGMARFMEVSGTQQPIRRWLPTFRHLSDVCNGSWPSDHPTIPPTTQGRDSSKVLLLLLLWLSKLRSNLKVLTRKLIMVTSPRWLIWKWKFSDQCDNAMELFLRCTCKHGLCMILFVVFE